MKMTFSLFAGLCIGYVFLTIPPALEPLMRLYDASYTAMSVLISALLWSHALMQVPSGMIADRLGVRRALWVSLTLIGGGNLAAAAVPNLQLAIAGRVLTGVGTGLSFVTLMKMIALHAPGGRAGTFQAFFGGFFSLGSIAAYLLMPNLVVDSWRWTYLTPGLLPLPLLLMLFTLELRPSPTQNAAVTPLRDIVRTRVGWILGAYHALSYGSMLTLGNWVPSVLAEVWEGKINGGFAWGGALVMLTSGVGRLSGGLLLWRLSPLRIANGSILILFILFAGLFWIPHPKAILVLAVLTAWFASINFGAFFQIASGFASTGSLATFLGFVNFLANLGAILFTLIFGWVKDTMGSFAWGFALLGIFSLTAFMLGHAPLRREISARERSLEVADSPSATV
jgi:nitrate/nitrite transporter NarK